MNELVRFGLSLLSGSSFTEEVVRKIADGIAVGDRQVAVERFEVAESFFWTNVRIRCRVLHNAPRLQDPDRVSRSVWQDKQYTVSNEWRPEPFYFFVFTNKISIDKNVQALVRFVEQSQYALAPSAIAGSATSF
jgi:hypothetical protein